MRRLLALVSAIVLVESVFFAVLAPLLPRFAEEFDLSKAQAGALSAAYAAGALLAALPSGVLAVRAGVKVTVVSGLVLIALTSIAFGLADEVWILFAARLGQGVGSALAWTGGLAWLVAAAPRDRRGELIGIAMGAAVAGALLGPVLGGVAAEIGLEPAFALVAFAALALAGCALAVPAFAPAAHPQPLSAILRAARERELQVGFWLVSVSAFLLGVISVVAPLRLDALGWSALGISGAFLVSAGIEAALNPVLGRWSDRRGRLAPVRAGLVLCVACSLLLPLADSRWPALVLVVAASVAYGFFWVPGTALLSDGAERARLEHGLSFALLNVAWAPANVVGASLGGALAELVGDAAAYLLAAAVCAATLIGLRRGRRRASAVAVDDAVG